MLIRESVYRILRHGGWLLLASACVACGGEDDENDPETGPFSVLEDVPDALFLNAVWSFGPEDVWVAADSGRMLHYTGSWSEVTLPDGVTVVDLWSYAPGQLIGIGGNHLVRFDGTEWTTEDLSGQGLGGSFYGGVWGAADDDIWVVGDQSTAAHFDGATWTRYLAAGPDNTVVWGTPGGDVYTASVFQTGVFDGTDWQDVEDIDSGGEAIFGFGDDEVWVADGSQLWNREGSRWSLTEIDGIGDITNMWGTGPSDLWGAGNFGAIYRYDGASWEQLANQATGSPFLRVFYDIHGSGQGDVWAIGGELGDAGNTPIIYRADL